MTPTPRSDGSHPSAPVDQAPLVGGSIAVACARELKAACMATSGGVGVTVVETFQFLHFDRDSGCCVDHPVHSHGGTRVR